MIQGRQRAILIQSLLFMALSLWASSLAQADVACQTPLTHYGAPKEVRGFQWEAYSQTLDDLKTQRATPQNLIASGVQRVESAMAIADYVTQTDYFSQNIKKIGRINFKEPLFLLRPQVFYKRFFKEGLPGLPQGFQLPYVGLERRLDATTAGLSLFESSLVMRQTFSTEPKSFYEAIQVLAVHVNTIRLYQQARGRENLPRFSLKRLRPARLSPGAWLSSMKERLADLLHFMERLSLNTEHELLSDLPPVGPNKPSTNRAWIGLSEVSWRLLTGFYAPLQRLPRDSESLREFLNEGPLFRAMRFRLQGKWLATRMGQVLILGIVAQYSLSAYSLVDAEIYAEREAQAQTQTIEDRSRSLYTDEMANDLIEGANFLEQELFNDLR